MYAEDRLRLSFEIAFKSTSLIFCAFLGMFVDSDIGEDFDDDLQEYINSHDWDSSFESGNGSDKEITEDITVKDVTDETFKSEYARELIETDKENMDKNILDETSKNKDLDDVVDSLNKEKEMSSLTVDNSNASWTLPSAEEKRRHFSMMFSTKDIDPPKEPETVDFAAGDSCFSEIEKSSDCSECLESTASEISIDSAKDGGDLPIMLNAAAVGSGNDIVLPVETKADDEDKNIVDEFNNSAGNLSFLDQLLTTPTNPATPVASDETADVVDDPMPPVVSGFARRGLTKGFDEEVFENFTVWDDKTQVYGTDFFIESGRSVIQPKVVDRHFVSVTHIDFIEKLFIPESASCDVDRLLKPPGPHFNLGEIVEPLPGYWSLMWPSEKLEELSTHALQEYILAAVNSRCKLDLVIGVDQNRKAVGCVLDRCKRDVLQQAFEFAVANEIEPPVAFFANIVLLQVGSFSDQNYIVRITVDNIVSTYHHSASGVYFLKNGEEIRDFTELEEMEKFLKESANYKEVQLEKGICSDGSGVLSCAAATTQRPLIAPVSIIAAFVIGFFARKAINHFSK